MTAPSAKSPPRRPSLRVPLSHPCLEIHLRAAPDGPVIACEPVLPSDLAPMVQEAWLNNCLRQGKVSVSPDGIPTNLLLVPDDHSPTRCLGYAVEMPGGDGAIARSIFTHYSVSDTAQRALARLALPEEQASGMLFHYDLHIRETTASPEPPPDSPLSHAALTRRPLHYLSVPLEPLLRLATPSSPFAFLPVQKAPFSVFYTRAVLRQAEQYSRKGAETNAHFESGAVLAGCLCSCPESGEFFVVVLEAFEVTQASQTLVSLAYSGESWARIQSQIRALQQTQPCLRMVGQAHGHNFVPEIKETGADGHLSSPDEVTNLFASSEDQTWSRAVFSQQPWHLCHIFGLTARCAPIDGLFTQHDGRLSHRAYHVLPDFYPGDYPTATAASPLNS